MLYSKLLFSKIDGLLFYHKRTHYTFGSTPLVVWLKPYMLPEILNIPVPDKLSSKRPDNYTTYAAHMELVAKEKEKKEEEIKSKKEARQKEREAKGETEGGSPEKGKKKKGRRNKQQGFGGYQQGHGYDQGYGYEQRYGYGYGHGYQDYYSNQDYYCNEGQFQDSEEMEVSKGQGHDCGQSEQIDQNSSGMIEIHEGGGDGIE